MIIFFRALWNIAVHTLSAIMPGLGIGMVLYNLAHGDETQALLYLLLVLALDIQEKVTRLQNKTERGTKTAKKSPLQWERN